MIIGIFYKDLFDSFVMIKAFVFDVGDSIEPSTGLEIECLNGLKREYSLPDSFVKVYLKEDKYHELHMFHAQGEYKIMENVIKKLKLKQDAKELLGRMKELYWQKLEEYYSKDERGREWIKVVKYLKKSGHKIAILSDNSLEAKRLYADLWKKFGLSFEVHILSAEVGVEKPDKKMFQEALDQLKVSPEEAVYFGNNLNRDSVAEKYGWKFIWVYGFMDDVKIDEFLGEKMRYINLKNIKSFLGRDKK